jgi:flagellar hook-length control protein FliK
MTFIPGFPATEMLPVAQPISIAPPPVLLTRLFASLLENAADSTADTASAGEVPPPETDGLNKAGAENPAVRFATRGINDALIDWPSALTATGIGNSDALAELHSAVVAELGAQIVTTTDSDQTASVDAKLLGSWPELPSDLSQLLDDSIAKRASTATSRVIVQESSSALRNAQIALGGEAEIQPRALAASALGTPGAELLEEDGAGKSAIQDNKLTRTVKLRIDQDAWQKISNNPRPVRIEIPVDLDIPLRPQPVRSDVDKQLLALTEIGKRSQANRSMGALLNPIEIWDASDEGFAHPIQKKTSALAKLGISGDVTAFQAGDDHSEIAWPTRQSLARLDTAVEGSLYDRIHESETARPQLAPENHIEAPPCAASPVATLSQAASFAAKSSANSEMTATAPNVRFTFEDWMPGQTVSHLRVSLDPAEFGGVRVHLSARGGELFARIVVEQPAALPIVASNFAALRSAMAERGIQFSGFSVTLAGAASAAGLPGDARPRTGWGERKEHSRTEEKYLKYLKRVA